MPPKGCLLQVFFAISALFALNIWLLYLILSLGGE